ncbi:MAG: Molecular chaperone GrpE (heat shock protein) [Gammaproteobacteria bacterium]|nr:MAG: Molecular chaperone GrpE (heat shock protein) [Gammaproteobacteria bacterium]TND04768.1 MAG: Molecular chaperone GrpE (heat shock protein) [Gammaproteobacteria bacterium]
MTNQESAAPEAAEQAADIAGEGPGEATEVAVQGPASGTVEELQQALMAAEQKVAEHIEQILRGRAELENMRRRTERELANAHKYAIEKFAMELLPVRDSLKLGLAAVGESSADVARLKEGMDLTLKILTAAMAKFGIAELNPEGDKFNPALHQAVAVLPGDGEPNTVLTVHQHGYLLHDRLIRPAMVVVSGARPTGDSAAHGNVGDVGQNT